MALLPGLYVPDRSAEALGEKEGGTPEESGTAEDARGEKGGPLKEWYRVRYEGAEAVAECGFCGKEVLRVRLALILESPNEFMERLDQKHVEEAHRDQLIDGLAAEWLGDDPSPGR